MKKIIISVPDLLGDLNTNSKVLTKTLKVSLTENKNLELDFDNTINNLRFTFATATDFNSGKINLIAAGMQVRSNKNWTGVANTSSVHFIVTDTENTNVSINNLSSTRNSTATVNALKITYKIINTGSKEDIGTNTFQIDYINNPEYIPPAFYILDQTNTLITP